MMPYGFINDYVGSGVLSMLVMLIAGIPMYVCATASIPIAAALLAKGISPGAALVFLISGPATNIVTMAVISKNMGKRSLFIYLISITIGSILMGVLLNLSFDAFQNGVLIKTAGSHEKFMPVVFQYSAGVILFLLILINKVKRKLFPSGKGDRQ